MVVPKPNVVLMVKNVSTSDIILNHAYGRVLVAPGAEIKVEVTAEQLVVIKALNTAGKLSITGGLDAPELTTFLELLVEQDLDKISNQDVLNANLAILDEWAKRSSGESPVKAEAASGTLTFSGAVIAEETVTVGSEVYEFAEDLETYEGSNIPVDISGGVGPVDAAAALVATITGNEDSLFEAAADGGAVTITAKASGASGNVEVSTTAENGAWGSETLEGGVDGTVARKGELRVDENYLYVCIADNTTADNNWKRVALDDMVWE